MKDLEEGTAIQLYESVFRKMDWVEGVNVGISGCQLFSLC